MPLKFCAGGMKLPMSYWMWGGEPAASATRSGFVASLPSSASSAAARLAAPALMAVRRLIGPANERYVRSKAPSSFFASDVPPRAPACLARHALAEIRSSEGAVRKRAHAVDKRLLSD